MVLINFSPLEIKFHVILFAISSQVITSVLANNRRINPLLRERIDNFVENIYFPYIGLSGGGLAIVQNEGELLYSTGYGYADQGKRIPNGNQTQSLLGSVTKVKQNKVASIFLIHFKAYLNAYVVILSQSITAVIVTKILHDNFPALGEAVLDTPIRQLIPQANFTLIDRYATNKF